MAKYFFMFFIVVVCLAMYAQAEPGAIESISRKFGLGLGEGLGEGLLSGGLHAITGGDSGDSSDSSDSSGSQ